MDAELLALCKQTITRYKYVGHDVYNDFLWQNDVVNQSVVLTGATPSLIKSPTGGVVIMTGMVVKDSTGAITYGLNTDYTIDYTLGTIVRAANSTIVSGATVKVTYSWQTISTFLARIEFDNILITDIKGQEFNSTCQIYTNIIIGIDKRDKLVLPAELLVGESEIKHIQYNPDEHGNIDHIVIYT